MIEEKLQDQEEELQNQLDVDTNDELQTHLNNIIRDCKNKPRNFSVIFLKMPSEDLPPNRQLYVC